LQLAAVTLLRGRKCSLETFGDTLCNVLPALLPIELFWLAFPDVDNLGPLQDGDWFGLLLL
jgi:hypothetical protein